MDDRGEQQCDEPALDGAGAASDEHAIGLPDAELVVVERRHHVVVPVEVVHHPTAGQTLRRF